MGLLLSPTSEIITLRTPPGEFKLEIPVTKMPTWKLLKPADLFIITACYPGQYKGFVIKHNQRMALKITNTKEQYAMMWKHIFMMCDPGIFHASIFF